jgi:hypothetical protein
VHEPINEPMNEDGLNEMVGKLLKIYSDVFIAELPNLSLTKEVDRAIDLMSDVKFIS